MSKPAMTPGGFVEAVLGLSAQTKRTPSEVANAIGKNVEIRPAERVLTLAERSALLTGLARRCVLTGVRPTDPVGEA